MVDQSWDVSEPMSFDSYADQAAYQTHPLHTAFIASCADVWAKVVVYDIVDATSD